MSFYETYDIPPGLGNLVSEDACWSKIWAIRETHSGTFENAEMHDETSPPPKTPGAKGDSEESLAAISCLKYMTMKVFGTPDTHFSIMDHQVFPILLFSNVVALKSAGHICSVATTVRIFDSFFFTARSLISDPAKGPTASFIYEIP